MMKEKSLEKATVISSMPLGMVTFGKNVLIEINTASLVYFLFIEFNEY